MHKNQDKIVQKLTEFRNKIKTSLQGIQGE